MATIKEEAEAYEPPQTHNIADLDAFPIDAQLHDGEGTDNKGETFKYKYAEFNGVEYRIPGVVLGEIKKMLKLKPDLKKVKVIRKGSGVQTRYYVEPIDNIPDITGKI